MSKVRTLQPWNAQDNPLITKVYFPKQFICKFLTHKWEYLEKFKKMTVDPIVTGKVLNQIT